MKEQRSARARLYAVAALVALTLASVPAEARAQDFPVAIVVHPETRVENVTFDELRRIFTAQQQFWGDKSRITLLVRAPVARERAMVLNKIYRMSEDQFRQFWIAKMFRADVASGPKIVYSSEMARELVAAIPGAITFLPLDAVTADLKVLRIDGRLPGDTGYPLR
jgi:ABC-type phosphate transport system substrate-binding protein